MLRSSLLGLCQLCSPIVGLKQPPCADYCAQFVQPQEYEARIGCRKQNLEVSIQILRISRTKIVTIHFDQCLLMSYMIDSVWI